MIRPVERNDVPAWATMRARLWPEAEAAALTEEARAFIDGRAVPGIDAAFIVEDDAAQAAGFLELSVRAFSDGCDSMPVPHVEGWYVEPSARGRGLGRNLLRRAEGWARERGFTELASDTGVDNEASLRAHVHCGFAEVERLIKFRKVLR
ncbi:MAG: GNAT family N-acetyltransferase [Candidatus Velthaea sp.]